MKEVETGVKTYINQHKTARQMQSAAIPPSPTRQTTPNPVWEGCKPVIIAVIPEPSSPKNGRPRSRPRCRQPAEPNPACWAQCDLQTPHKPLTSGAPGCTVLYHPISPKQPRGGKWVAADPVSSSVEGQREGAIPPFRRSEGSARYPPTACRRGYMGRWAGEKHGLRDWGWVELARGAVAAVGVVVSSGRMRAGWWLVGHSFSTLLL